MDNLDRIENYFNDQLNEDEKISFEKEIESSATLQQEVQDYTLLISGIKTASIRNKLKNFANDDEINTRKSPKLFKLNIQVLSIAASIALLVGFFFALNIKNGTNSKNSFEEFYYIDPGQPVVMGEVDDIMYSEAMNDYKSQNYEKAKYIFEQKCNESDDEEACYYFAQCLLNLGELKAASIKFKQLIEVSSGHWKQKAEWHLSYSLWKNNDPEYLEVLKDIQVDQNHLYYEEAIQIE